MLDTDRLRADTPGTASVFHLNAAGAALMPQPVIDAMKRHIDLEARLGGYRAAVVRAGDIESVYEAFATLLACQPHNVAIVDNATSGFNLALSAVDWQPGDVLLTTDNDYCSNFIAYHFLQKRFGIRVERAPESERGGFEPAATMEAISRIRPRVVAVSHIPTSSGLIQPVETLTEAARDAGSLYIVDGCQSLGQVVVNTNAFDIYTASTRKFLRGPRGVGILVIGDQLLDTDFAPLLPDMRGATWDAPGKVTLQRNARRFENWEFNYAAVLGAGAAAEYALSIGMDAIERHLLAAAQRLRDRIRDETQWTVLDTGDRLGAIVTAHKNASSPGQITEALLAARVQHSITDASSARLDFAKKGIGWALRLSPHVYTNDADVDAAIHVLADA